jgi:hypothetical protein
LLLSILNDSVRASTDLQLARLSGIEFPAAPAPDPQTIIDEVAAIRSAIDAAHGVRLRFVIWAGAGAPDALGAMKGGPMSYTLDSADPEKLKAIVDDMQHRAHEPIAKLLPSTVVIGESVAAEKILSIYQKFGIDATPNFITIDTSRGYAFALAFANRDLKAWIDGATLTEAETADAIGLAAFLHVQSQERRDKITLLLPPTWSAAGVHTRREFDGINLVVGEKPNPRQYHKATEPVQDRVFVIVQRKGEADSDANAIKNLRAAGYPMAALTFAAKAPLSHYLQFMECTAFALRRLRTTQPDADPRDALTAEIMEEAKREGGIEKTAAWKALPRETPKTLAASISSAARSHAFSCGEIAFFGDLRYSENRVVIHKVLDAGARLLFRTPFKMPAGVVEAPGEMLIGHGGCFTILVLSAAQDRFALAAFEPDRHIAQFLATKVALEKKRRLVRAILVKDLSIESLAGLDEFFSQTARNLSSGSHQGVHGEIQSR